MVPRLGVGRTKFTKLLTVMRKINARIKGILEKKKI